MLLEQRGAFESGARLAIDGIPTNVSLKVVGNLIEITVPEGINNPKFFGAQSEYLRAKHESREATEISLEITPRGQFDMWSAQVGDLRSAYLACFAKFGYTWALLPGLDIVREQILRPDVRTIKNAWLIKPENFPNQPLIIEIVPPVAALAVIIGIVIVLLPWMPAPDGLYERVGSLLSENRTLAFAGRLVGWPSGMEMTFDRQEAAQ
jgi:hypothetical protein